MPGLGSKAIRSGKKARRPKQRKHHNPLGLPGECWDFLGGISRRTPAETRAAIQHLMEQLGWSKLVMASVMGVRVDTLKRWLNGDRAACSPVRRLVEILELILLPQGKT